MPTIREYLQADNPELLTNSTTSRSTYNHDWEPLEGFEQFIGFDDATLESLYSDVLNHKFDRKDLPAPHELLQIEKLIFSERELEQDPLKRWIVTKVNFALIAAYAYLSKKERSVAFNNAPAIVCGTKEPSEASIPDWVGYQHGFLGTFLCGETKLSTVFAMQNIIKDQENPLLHRPFEQCMHYCAIKDTRYGYIITDKELVVLRIRKGDVGAGIATQRPARAIPPAAYVDGSSSIDASMKSPSQFSNSKPQTPKWIQYCVVRWDATDGLTVCLALFWLTLMAYAPDINVKIENGYARLNRWEWDAGEKIFRNNTSGRTRKVLSKDHVELINWEEALNPEGRKYFFSYRGTTYVQAVFDKDSKSYFYYDNFSGHTSWEKPQGLYWTPPI